MQVASNHKSPISLPKVLDSNGKISHTALKLEPGLNTVDAEHFEACCGAANPAWLKAMFEPGAMRRDGKPTLEVLDGEAPGDAVTDRKPAKAMIELAKSATTREQLDQIWAAEVADDVEPRQTVHQAIQKRGAELDEAAAEAEILR